MSHSYVKYMNAVSSNKTSFCIDFNNNTFIMLTNDPEDVFLKEKEQCEDRRFYGFVSGGGCELKVSQKADSLEICQIGQAYNKSGNPILHSIAHPRNGLPAVVYALVEHHHLDKGDKTSQNSQLAREIRLLGGVSEVGGVTTITHDCGQIVTPLLGGRMERQNVFPVGRTVDFADLIGVENNIYDFIKKKRGLNGRAYLCYHMAYNTPHKPNCPSRLEFFYKLMTDDSHGSQVFHEGVNAYLKVYVPEIQTEVHITDLSFEQAMAETVLDRESQRFYEDLLDFNRNKNLSPDLLGDIFDRVQAGIEYIKNSPEIREAITQQLNILIPVVKNNSLFGDSLEAQRAIETVELLLGNLSQNLGLPSNE